jgi:CheY-like chemotaxis protein
MPDINGFMILEDLVKHGKTIPTLIISNLSQEEDKQKVLGHGALEFLEKSNVTIAHIVEKVQKYAPLALDTVNTPIHMAQIVPPSTGIGPDPTATTVS